LAVEEGVCVDGCDGAVVLVGAEVG